MQIKNVVRALVVLSFVFALSCDDSVSNGTPISDDDAALAAQEAAIDGVALAGFHDLNVATSDAAYIEASSLLENLLGLAAAMDAEALHAGITLPKSVPMCQGVEDESNEDRINFDCPHLEGHIEQVGNVFDIELTLVVGITTFTIEDSGSEDLTITDSTINGKIEILDGDETQLVEATFDNVRFDNDDCLDTVTGGTLRVETPVGEGHSHILAVFGPACDMVQLFDQGGHDH